MCSKTIALSLAYELSKILNQLAKHTQNQTPKKEKVKTTI